MTRKAGEKIIIGGEIAITILPCHGGQVRLGIDAPRAVGIVRAELLQRQGTPPTALGTATVASAPLPGRFTQRI